MNQPDTSRQRRAPRLPGTAWTLSNPPSAVAGVVLLALILLAYPLNMFREVDAPARYLAVPLALGAGILAAEPLGLRLAARSWRENVVVPLLAGLGIGVAIVVLDPHSLARSDYTTLLYYPQKSAAEELVYRLAITTCLTWAIVTVLQIRGSIAVPFMLAAGVAQGLNIALGVKDAADMLVYAGLRYWVPGMVWAWLYLRHGLLAAIVGHSGTHLWLDPALAQLNQL